jgi:hypothetical protein
LNKPRVYLKQNPIQYAVERILDFFSTLVPIHSVLAADNVEFSSDNFGRTFARGERRLEGGCGKLAGAIDNQTDELDPKSPSQSGDMNP